MNWLMEKESSSRWWWCNMTWFEVMLVFKVACCSWWYAKRKNQRGGRMETWWVRGNRSEHEWPRLKWDLYRCTYLAYSLPTDCIWLSAFSRLSSFFSGLYSTLSLSVGVVSNRQPKNFGYLRYHTMYRMESSIQIDVRNIAEFSSPYKSWIASSV